ncbi:MAG: hypothetical protein WCP28_15650 [Actinomycetes bacterium]
MTSRLKALSLGSALVIALGVGGTGVGMAATGGETGQLTGASTATSVRTTAAAAMRSLPAGLVLDKGNKKNLPGWHSPGVHVRRGSLPRIGAMRFAPATRGRQQVVFPVSVRKTLAGSAKALRKGHSAEFVAGVVRVTPKVTKNQQQSTAFMRTILWRLPNSNQSAKSFTITLPRSVWSKLKKMAPGARKRAVSVSLGQFVNTNGDLLYEHRKLASTTMQNSQAKHVGQSMVLALSNTTGTRVNVVANAGACMYVNGDNGSDLRPFTTMMEPGETIEHSVQADGGVIDTPQYNGMDLASMTAAIGKGIVQTNATMRMPIVTTAMTQANAAQSALIWKDLSYCVREPSTFSLYAADGNGNMTAQGYVMSGIAPSGLISNDNAVDWISKANWNQASAMKIIGITDGHSTGSTGPTLEPGFSDNGLSFHWLKWASGMEADIVVGGCSDSINNINGQFIGQRAPGCPTSVPGGSTWPASGPFPTYANLIGGFYWLQNPVPSGSLGTGGCLNGNEMDQAVTYTACSFGQGGWNYIADGANYTLRTLTGCLTVVSSTELQAKSCDGSLAQSWSVASPSTITKKATQFVTNSTATGAPKQCLDVNWAGSFPAAVWPWTCSATSTSQFWTLTPKAW